MDIHSDYAGPTTPSLSYDIRYWRAEDSGYHTSHTPGSLECSELNDEHLHQPIITRNIRLTKQYQIHHYDTTPDVHFKAARICSTGYSKSAETHKDTPKLRRGVKRTLTEEIENAEISQETNSTPTSILSGGLHRLKFNDSHIFNSSITSVNLEYSNTIKNDSFLSDSQYYSPYPSTPIKKICRSGCKLNSSKSQRKPVKNLGFVMHSLSCDRSALQPIITSEEKKKPPPIFNIKPNQKIDIIKMLHYDASVRPPISKIFSYLSYEDISNFKLVSHSWLNLWEDMKNEVNRSKAIEKLEYFNIKEDRENKMSTPITKETHHCRPLVEIQNVLNKSNPVYPTSPTKSPRTIRFNKFAKTASLDLRTQLPCVRCQQPSKITEEGSGEEWAECTSQSCSFQFCNFCKCERHPGKKCFQYDLDGPSPSKRSCRKNIVVVGTKKSRKNLRRLL